MMSMIDKIPFQTRPNPEPKPETDIDKLTKLVTNLATNVATLTQTVAQIQAQPPTKHEPVKQQPQVDPMSEEFKGMTPEEIQADPAKAMEIYAAEAVRKQLRNAQPAVDSAFDARLELLRNRIKAQDPGLYDFVEKEFNEFVEKIDPQMLVHKYEDGSYGLENAFNQIVGKNHKKYIAKLKDLPTEREKREVPFTESPGVRETPQLSDGERLSAAELEVANRLGVTPEQYRAAQKTSVITTPDLGGLRGNN